MNTGRAVAARFSALLTALARAPGGVAPKVWRSWAILIALAGAGAIFAVANAPAIVSVHAAFVFLLAWVMFAALIGGLWGGLAAAAAGLIATWAMGGARGLATGGEVLSFAALAIVFSALGHLIWRSRLRQAASVRVLEQREAHLRSIFDAAPEAMIVIDERGIIQAYGASAERMFGWRPSAVIGRNISMLMPQPFREQHDGYLQRYLTTGERRIIGIGRVVVGLRSDGATFPMELTVAEVRSPHGRSFTGFVRDLTAHAEREGRLKELQAEIVHISRLSAMGEMASSLAHELNQPLSAIANYLNGARQILAREGQSDAVEGVEKAVEQTLRAGDIIRRMRDFLTRGEGERSVESLGKMVHEACALALVGAKESGVDVRYDIDAHLDHVLVDRVQIQQVIVNLVRNALDAMREEERRALDVATRLDGDMAVVSVADTGPGLAPEAAERLFQPFFSTKTTGMGVGLSISRTIVEGHGGRIWTDANPGGGAAFHFTIPLAVEDEKAAMGA